MSKPFVAVMISSLLVGACATTRAAVPAGASQPAAETPSVATATPIGAPEQLPPASSGTSAAPALTSPTAPLNDGQIVQVLEALDNGEIEQAQVALKTSNSARVRKFAQEMLQQHTKSKQRASQLAQTAKLMPTDSAVAQRVKYKATAFVESLRTVNPAGFDALYIGAQDGEHEDVLGIVNTKLVPAASHAELKSLLKEAAAMIESHVAEAKRVEQELAHDKSSSTAPVR